MGWCGGYCHVLNQQCESPVTMMSWQTLPIFVSLNTKLSSPPSTCLQFNFNNSLVWDLVLGLNCQNLFRGAKLSFRNKDLSGTNKTFTGIRFAQDRNHNVLDMRFLIKSLCWWWWRWCCWLWHYCLRKGAAYIRWPLTYSPFHLPILVLTLLPAL